MKQVYFNEFNLLMGSNTYLPLVSGILHAYAMESGIVRRHYTFMPYNFHIDDPVRILDAHDNPDVAAFSVSMWNERLSLKVAREVKQRFPQCIIVFGGAQVPHNSIEYLRNNAFIDITVRGEGEESFREILEALVLDGDVLSIPGVTARDHEGVIIACKEERETSKDLDKFPSPYLKGMYDNLIESHPELNFQAIIETNRGCPFKCTFCYWGMGGLRRKYRFHSLDRVRREIEWIAKHEISYVFNADSNFGMHRRDEEIAKFLIDTKSKYGYPEKFRTCYGKNTDERIFGIGSSLHEHQLEKGITISYQSVDEQVQKNIKRDNIKLSVAEELQRKFNELNVPVYTEMILGLPGESAESWKRGVDRILNSGLKNQLFLYICEILPNTDLADPLYRKLHSIRSRCIELTEIHVSPRKDGWVKEIEEIVVETDTMPVRDWQRMLCFSWATMLFHSLKTAFYIMAFLRREYGVNYSDVIGCFSEGEFRAEKYPMLKWLHKNMLDKSNAILQGEGRGVLAPEYGDIYWEQEEVMFFEISNAIKQFYSEFYGLICDHLERHGYHFDKGLLKMVFDYQAILMPGPRHEGIMEYSFSHNLPEYFENLFTSREVRVFQECQVAKVAPECFGGDRVRYARETILWKRKNGNFFNQLEWKTCQVGSCDAYTACN